METALVLAPEWLFGLIERLFSRKPEVMREMRIVRNVAENGPLRARASLSGALPAHSIFGRRVTLVSRRLRP